MQFLCSECKGIISVGDEDLGAHVACGHCQKTTQVPTGPFEKSAIIDNDFVILDILGNGGMGVVYYAHQMSLDRPVALKILMDKFTHNTEFIADFIREARAAARLNHSNIVQSYAVGNDNGIYYIAMEYVDGYTFKELLDQELSVPLPFALDITRQTAEALGYGWEQAQLVHRDIKPDNIMLLEGSTTAKVMDLGLSRYGGDSGEVDDEEDEIMGTPQYISPEQLMGSKMDFRGDLYSLGATLFHAITGRFPFEGDTAGEIARQHLQEPLPAASSINPAIPTEIDDLLRKMMAKYPDERHASAEELIAEITVITDKLSGKKPARNTRTRLVKPEVDPLLKYKVPAPLTAAISLLSVAAVIGVGMILAFGV